MIDLVDLYCKAGGCSEGYARAAKELGIEIRITGVDIDPQPNYKFNFVQMDAVQYLKKNGHLHTHVHASPPCQENSRTKSLHSNEYEELLVPTREECNNLGLPYVIENVIGAKMKNAIILDSLMSLKMLLEQK